MADSPKGTGTKLFSLAKTELSARLDDIKINSADKAASASSSTFAWLVIAVFAFFTYLTFVMWAPVFIADLYTHKFNGQGNPVLFGYSVVFLFHLVILLFLLIFRRLILKRIVYNKVFEAILNIGEK